MSPAAFDYDVMRVRAAIYDEKAWAALIINPNATALAMQAIQQGNTSYDPAGAFQLIIVSAREDTTIYSYGQPFSALLVLDGDETNMSGCSSTRCDGGHELDDKSGGPDVGGNGVEYGGGE